MSNPLTGDFQAVLQVSGGTINRLLASLHQNAFENPELPSFPHSVRMRIGDDHAYQGVRGVVHAQIGVPRVELIHGVSDRFWLEVVARVWYRPDPGTEPLRTYIHGTIHAEYRLQAIDPSCLGWASRAANFLWIRVVRDSVRFQGTANDEVGPLGVLDTSIIGVGSDPAADIAKITRQIAHLLARRFEATPHPVSKGFRQGALRSLNQPNAGSAVALAIGVSGDPVGAIGSINTVFLGSADLAVGISRDYILSLMAPMLQAIRDFHTTVWVHVATGKYNPIPDFDTVYRVGMHLPTVEWEPHGTHALIKINLSGWANTDSIAPNVTFDVTQAIVLDFDAAAGHLRLTPLAPAVTPHVGGPFGGFIEGQIRGQIANTVKPIVAASCNAAQPSLSALTHRTDDLTKQLQSLDGQATVRLDSAEFVSDGLMLRGTIGLAPRRPMVVKHSKDSSADAHWALESWIPGGRIDRFEWSWTWSGSGERGSANWQDRFLLRRPRAAKSRWGVTLGGRLPLPGLDGSGTVCLRIIGTQVDPVTGNFVPVTSTLSCKRYGIGISDVLTGSGRLLLRDMPELSRDVPFPQLVDLPLVSPRRGETSVSNTLLIYLEDVWDGLTAQTLAAGLEACRRYDAGIAILVLFREGLLDANGPAPIADIEGLLGQIGIAGHVNEDVGGTWAHALQLRADAGNTAWSIITPDGYPAWTHRGPLEPAQLAEALDAYLRRSPDVESVAFHPGIEVGTVVSAPALFPGYVDVSDILEEQPPHCPPLPFSRLGIDRTVITFVRGQAAATAVHLRSLAGIYGQTPDQGSAPVIVVVDGADQNEADGLKHSLGLDFITLGDPTGKITDRFRIGMWPTTINLARGGIVSDIALGIARHQDDVNPRPDSGEHHCCCSSN